MLFDLLWEISIFFIRSPFEYRILFEHCVNAIYNIACFNYSYYY
jgi:hypothetical protein